MNRYWFVDNIYVRRDLVESVSVTGSGSSWNVNVRTVSGQNLVLANFLNQPAAQAELERVLAEEV